nr:amino acid permease 3-like [Aegilops tauschii subsp. strangulata]
MVPGTNPGDYLGDDVEFETMKVDGFRYHGSGKDVLTMRIKVGHDLVGTGLFSVEFDELFQLYNQKALDKTLVTCYCLFHYILLEIKFDQGAKHVHAGVNMFRLAWRTAFVDVSMVLAILLPFFNDILGLLGVLGFWPLTIYFPMEMYIRQIKVKRSSWKWVALQTLSFVCFAVTVGVTVESVQGITQSLKNYVPFKTKL